MLFHHNNILNQEYYFTHISACIYRYQYVDSLKCFVYNFDSAVVGTSPEETKQNSLNNTLRQKVR